MTEPVYFLGDQAAYRALATLRPQRIRSAAQALDAATQSPAALWIAQRSEAIPALPLSRLPKSDLLLLEPLPEPRLALLSSLFRKVVELDASRYAVVRRGEMADILAARNADELFLAGVVDHQMKALLLVRGNLERLVVPLTSFRPSGSGIEPDFAALEIRDHGNTVAFGGYEASADAILYENDPRYRRKLKKARLAKDRTLGASIRRARLQRGMKRSDFSGISEKEIARIERNEVTPKGETLERLAKHLGIISTELTEF